MTGDHTIECFFIGIGSRFHGCNQFFEQCTGSLLLIDLSIVMKVSSIERCAIVGDNIVKAAALVFRAVHSVISMDRDV